MSFSEGAEGRVKQPEVPESSRKPAPQGRAAVARALYLSLVKEAFVLSADSSVKDSGGHLADESAVRASAPDGDRGCSCPASAPAAASVNYPGAVITGGHR